MNDPLAINKILAGFLCACLLLIGAGKFASFMQGDRDSHGEGHGHHEVKLSHSYPISVPESLVSEKKITTNTPIPLAPILALISSADVAAGQKVSKKCSACHSFNADGPNKVGPNLWNVVNKSMGSVDGFKYSKALISMNGSWDYDSLNQFLLKPKNYINGTKMNFAGLKKDKDRANLIGWLRSLSENPVPLPTQEEIEKESSIAE